MSKKYLSWKNRIMNPLLRNEYNNNEHRKHGISNSR